MSDLISKLGAKNPVDPKTGTETPVSTNISKESVKKNTDTVIGEDIMAMANGKRAPEAFSREAKPVVEAASSVEPSTETSANSAQGTAEAADGKAVSEPDSWTKESAFKEVKRLREENKTYRVKFEEKLDKLNQEAMVKLSEREKELEHLKKAQQELEEIKAKEADKKRNLEEKLLHRESLLTEQRTRSEQLQKDYETKLSEYKNKLDRYQADIEAQNQVYQNRLQQELGTVPEKFRDMAELLTKGAGDPREAIVALSEAKLKGLFEDKTVVVNHSVPGAKDGARATKERLEEAGRAERGKMTSSQKIGQALKDIRSGNANSAFRLGK